MIGNGNHILSWKSNGWSDETIKPPTASKKSLAPGFNYYNAKMKVKFNGICLKQDKITYTHKNVVSIYIVYELGASSSHSDDPTLKNPFFGAVKLTKNADI